MLKNIGNFFQETKQELKKVTWPNREELWQATTVVIFTTFIMAVYIGMIDFCLSAVIRILLG